MFLKFIPDIVFISSFPFILCRTIIFHGNNLLFIHSPGCLCNYEYRSSYEQSFTVWWRSILNTFSYTYWLFVFLHYEVSVQIITHFVTVAFLLLFYRSFLCILDTYRMYVSLSNMYVMEMFSQSVFSLLSLLIMFLLMRCKF